MHGKMDDEYVDSYLMARHWTAAFAGGDGPCQIQHAAQHMQQSHMQLSAHSEQAHASHTHKLWCAALRPLPDFMTSPCCSEFMVTRERIQARPKAFYKRLRCLPALSCSASACGLPWSAMVCSWRQHALSKSATASKGTGGTA